MGLNSGTRARNLNVLIPPSDLARVCVCACLMQVAVEMFGRALTQVDQQIAVLLVTFTLMALVNMACSPAKSRLLTLLDFFSLAVLILTLSLSLFFVTEAPLERSQAVS